MLGGQLRDFATGRTTYPAFLEDIGKLRETKADPYGAPNHLYANDRLRRIEAVSALASHWSWEKTQLFVVAQRVAAHSGHLSNLA
jgi:hypothetical protein